MTQRVVGYACAGLAVALMVFSLWFSTAGKTEAGLLSIALGLALLLVAASTLRSSGNRI
ncbi:MAG: hypothetical protein M3416_07760 [Acidobacteriota bacterium]|nr:hypothetical protein [Acidobacteriota bacterium]